jgi:glycosyltransferase involved in cell wall biosynthesis
MEADPMTVLLIVDDFPPAICGVGDYAAHLANGLSKKGVEVTVLTKSQAGVGESSVHPSYTIRPSIRDWSYSEIGTVLQELDALPATTIVHIQYSSASNYNRRFMINVLPTVLRILRRQVRVVVTMHGFHEQRHRWRLRATPMLVSSHYCILVHPKDYELVTRTLVACNRAAFVPISSNIPSVASSSDDRLITRKSLGVASSDRIVVFFGNMRKEKGLLELIAAVSRARSRVPNLKLVLVGGLKTTVLTAGRYERALFKAIEQAQTDNMLVMVCNPEPFRVAQLLRAADLAVFPFQNGVAGNRGSVLAAIVNEVAVLTTAGVSTPPEFAEQYGIDVVPAGDLKALTNRMTDLLLDARELEILRRRNSRAAQKISWEAVTERHLDIYHGMLSSPFRDLVQ